MSGICGFVSRRNSRLEPSSSQSSHALSLSPFSLSLPPVLLLHMSWVVIGRYIHCVHPHLLRLRTQVFSLYYHGKHVHKMSKVNKGCRASHVLSMNGLMLVSNTHSVVLYHPPSGTGCSLSSPPPPSPVSLSVSAHSVQMLKLQRLRKSCRGNGTSTCILCGYDLVHHRSRSISSIHVCFECAQVYIPGQHTLLLIEHVVCCSSVSLCCNLVTISHLYMLVLSVV